jgi:hypothetical protein
MPKLEKAERRDREQKRRKHGMRRTGDSVKTLRNIILLKAEKEAKKRQAERDKEAD